MATTRIDWQDAVTFEQYVLRLLYEGKSETEEFRVLIRVFGKTRIDAYFKKHQEGTGSFRYLTASDTRYTKLKCADSTSNTKDME